MVSRCKIEQWNYIVASSGPSLLLDPSPYCDLPPAFPPPFITSRPDANHNWSFPQTLEMEQVGSILYRGGGLFAITWTTLEAASPTPAPSAEGPHQTSLFPWTSLVMAMARTSMKTKKNYRHSNLVISWVFVYYMWRIFSCQRDSPNGYDYLILLGSRSFNGKAFESL